MLSARNRFLIGGMGGIAPVVVNLVVIDLETLLLSVTLLVVISYLIRVVVLFVIGGFVTLLNKERDPFKIFQLGIAAPALITAFLNGNQVSASRQAHLPRVTPAVMLSTSDSLFVPLAYAQTPGQPPRKQFALPNETAAQQISRGLFGTVQKNVWFVIAGSQRQVEDAERQAQHIREIGFSAEVYEPYGGNASYAIVIGAGLSRAEAQQLRDKAIKAGLAQDTYLWTFPEAR